MRETKGNMLVAATPQSSVMVTFGSVTSAFASVWSRQWLRQGDTPSQHGGLSSSPGTELAESSSLVTRRPSTACAAARYPGLHRGIVAGQHLPPHESPLGVDTMRCALYYLRCKQ
jgi:hypothetical protein